MFRPRERAPAGEGVMAECLSAAAVLRWPFPWTMLSASEGCAPRAQRARAAALRLQEQAGQYGLHATAVQEQLECFLPAFSVFQ